MSQDKPYIGFYEWGNPKPSNYTSLQQVMHNNLKKSFESIEIKEDEETPELDYVLNVKGKEQGRFVIPFDKFVNDAYYDKESKEIVIIVNTDVNGNTKEIRFSVKDLIDIYKGDNSTININGNVVSITDEVMQKFVDLHNAISNESSTRAHDDASLNGLLQTEKSERKSADESLSSAIDDEKNARLSDVAELIESLSLEKTERVADVASLETRKQDNLTGGNLIEITNDNVINFTGDLTLYVLTLALPTKGEENKIYLVPNNGESLETSNKCSEWGWINNAWEKIGEISGLDLDQYVKNDWFNAQNFATQTFVNNVKSELNSSKANASHSHSINDVNNLQGELTALKSQLDSLKSRIELLEARPMSVSEEDDTFQPMSMSTTAPEEKKGFWNKIKNWF